MPLPVYVAPALKKVLAIGIANLSKKPKRTACWTVDAKDAPAFRAGNVARYKIDSTAAHIRDGLGWTDAELWSRFTVEQIADIHMNTFVPLCVAMEDGQHTEHPDVGIGAEIKRAADTEFERAVRAGELGFIDRNGVEVRRVPASYSAPASTSPFSSPAGPSSVAPLAPIATAGGNTLVWAGLGLLALWFTTRR